MKFLSFEFSFLIFYATFLLECPLKFLVGANSPNLWPTMNSVTYTGMNLLPL